MRKSKDPITAFRGAGSGRYSVAKLIYDRRAERREEKTCDRNTRNPIVTLQKRLAQVTADNLHREDDSGPAVGIEAW